MKKIAITIIMISALLPMVVSCSDSDEPKDISIPEHRQPCREDSSIFSAKLFWADSTRWMEFSFPADSMKPFYYGAIKPWTWKDYVKVTEYILLKEDFYGKSYQRVYIDKKATPMLIRADSTRLWAFFPDSNKEELMYDYGVEYQPGDTLYVNLFDSERNFSTLRKIHFEVQIDTVQKSHYSIQHLAVSCSKTIHSMKRYYLGEDIRFVNFIGCYGGFSGLLTVSDNYDSREYLVFPDQMQLNGNWVRIYNYLIPDHMESIHWNHP